MKLTYPVFIAKNKEDYLIYVPDMDLYTEGSSMAEAMEMARDAIGLKGIDMEAERLHINVSKVLQEALAEKITKTKP